MKFQVGDRIIILATKEEGKILDFENDDWVLVEVKGVSFIVHRDDIDFPYFHRFTQKPPPPPKKIVYIDQVRPEKKVAKESAVPGVFISFLPIYEKDVFDDDVVEKLKVHLINHNEKGYHFNYTFLRNGEVHFDHKNYIAPKSEFYLHDVQFEHLNDSPRFEFEFKPDKPEKGKVDFLETSLKLRAKQLFKKIEETREKGEATFAYFLFEAFPEKPVSMSSFDLSKLNLAGFRVYDAGKAQEFLPPAKSVIDLHIDRLTENPEKMSVSQMLDLQLQTFEQYYDLALAHRLDKLTVIHGIGEGVLRQSIHDLLKQRREVKHFEVGQNPGVTEIYFQ